MTFHYLISLFLYVVIGITLSRLGANVPTLEYWIILISALGIGINEFLRGRRSRIHDTTQAAKPEP